MSEATWKVRIEVVYEKQTSLSWLGPDDAPLYQGEFTGDGPALEAHVRDLVTEYLIGIDDERFDGPGTPISTYISIEVQQGSN